MRVAIEVLDVPFVEEGVLDEFLLVEADADDAPVLGLGRQVADPARHQIEDRAAGRENAPVEIRDAGDRRLVDMGDEARQPVELLVRRFIDTAERLFGEARHAARCSASIRDQR
jgi:hypothetical protein